MVLYSVYWLIDWCIDEQTYWLYMFISDNEGMDHHHHIYLPNNITMSVIKKMMFVVCIGDVVIQYHTILCLRSKLMQVILKLKYNFSLFIKLTNWVEMSVTSSWPTPLLYPYFFCFPSADVAAAVMCAFIPDNGLCCAAAFSPFIYVSAPWRALRGIRFNRCYVQRHYVSWLFVHACILIVVNTIVLKSIGWIFTKCTAVMHCGT